jgi:NADH-quinone oxidoreductase subunit J
MNVIFYISSAIAVLATILVITRANAVHALLYLVVSLLAVAMVFFTLGAPFAAALEVVVYAGAIVVLLVFVVMMLNQGPVSISQERAWLRPRIWIGPGILSLILLGELAYVLVGQPASQTVGQPASRPVSQLGRSDRSDESDMSDGSDSLRPRVSSLKPPDSNLPLPQSPIRNPQSAISQSPRAVGLALFGPYVIGVELASLLLLAGLVAAFHLGAPDESENGKGGER